MEVLCSATVDVLDLARADVAAEALAALALWEQAGGTLHDFLADGYFPSRLDMMATHVDDETLVDRLVEMVGHWSPIVTKRTIELLMAGPVDVAVPRLQRALELATGARRTQVAETPLRPRW